MRFQCNWGTSLLLARGRLLWLIWSESKWKWSHFVIAKKVFLVTNICRYLYEHELYKGLALIQMFAIQSWASFHRSKQSPRWDRCWWSGLRLLTPFDSGHQQLLGPGLRMATEHKLSDTSIKRAVESYRSPLKLTQHWARVWSCQVMVEQNRSSWTKRNKTNTMM